MSSGTSSRSRALLTLMRGATARWVALAVIVAVGSCLTLAGPLVLRRVVDDVAAGTTAGRVRNLAFVFLAIVVVGQFIAVWAVRVATRTAWDTTNELRLRITRHVLGLDHEFHRTHTPGELISRVDGDVTSVSDFLGKVVPKALGAFLLVSGIIVVLSVIQWQVGLGMFVFFAVAIGLVLLTRQRAVHEAADEMSANARLYGGLEERINASEDLRSNGAGAHAMWRFVEDSGGVIASATRRERAFMGVWWTVQGSIVIGTVLAISVSALLVSRGLMTLGTAFLLFQYVLLIGQPLEEFVHELETVQKASGAMVRVIDLLEVEPTVLDEGDVSPGPGAMSVECRDVQFDYGDDQPVLANVSITLGAGRSVGIVGRTGSGKTTFSRLVLRLVETTSGTVLLGGVPIADIPVRELRRRVALVPQEVELFGGSVRDNVTLFDNEPSDEGVESALRAVGLDALVEAGVDRDLGAGGGGLSAGEAQLLAMARVWLRDPDLVVLDEATARVDPETEGRLEAAVHRLMHGRTTLIIAHRLSTLREVDDILVFDHGEVAEFGPRDELAADPGSRYHRLLLLALEGNDIDRAEELDELGQVLA
ncbi:MAG TPA: ABC transporter ATP-binding protein [Ilumatobacter sp.]|nr:ABC transporter ATP-binding protein [Ilumatobacter sp.]